MADVSGPVHLVHSCGHAGVINCILTTDGYVEFSKRTRCLNCLTKSPEFQQHLHERDLGLIFESEPDKSVAEDEVTHLFCADCGDLSLIEDLALQFDGRRTCEACVIIAKELRFQREKLESEGQARLF